jgi:hypothetical protein
LIAVAGFPRYDERLPKILDGLKAEARQTTMLTRALLAVSLVILALTCVLVAHSL